MATDREQLNSIREDYIRQLYSGQPEAVLNRALKYLPRMDFETHDVFKKWADEEFENADGRIATDAEVEKILDYMGLGGEKDDRTKEDQDLDEIMNHL